MGRLRITRFAAKAGKEYERKLEELARNPPPPEPTPKKPERIPHSRIPTILSLHKQLGRIRNEISYLEAKHPESKRIHTLKRHYHKIDELLIKKLKEEK